MPSLLPSILIVLLAVVLFLAAVLIFRAMMYGRVPAPSEAADLPAVDGTLVAEHLAAAIQVQTVSSSGKEPPDRRVFDGMHRALEGMYPRAHAVLQRERVNDSALLYTWAGRAPELDPVMLCAHLDVVPCDPATLPDWTHPPFAGDVADGYVWGRGALDTKNSLITILEAVEGLIRAGYQPERTLYLAFGADEETQGVYGAGCIAGLLAERGARLAAVLDEGAAVVEGMLPGLSLPVALIGIAEKGYASVELRVEGRAGHAAMPPRHTAIGVLGRAIARLEEAPMPERMEMARPMFENLGPFLPFGTRLALANAWLLGGSVRKRLTASATTAALVRTSMAATMIHGGVKDNVLPAQVTATVNCRLMPGDTRAALLQHIRKAVNDEAVQVSLDESASWEASPVSPAGTPVYESLTRVVRQVFPEAVTAPYLVTATTDARYYTGLSENVYRFYPVVLDSALLNTMHGVDERIPVEALPRMVAFYHLLIKTWTTAVGNAE